MSHIASRDGFTAHSRPADFVSLTSNIVSPTAPARNPARNTARSVFNNTLIPRDYLSSLSKSRAGGIEPTPSQTSPPPKVGSQSLDLLTKPPSSSASIPTGRMTESPVSIFSINEDKANQNSTVQVNKTRQAPSDVAQSPSSLSESPQSYTSSNASDLLKTAMPRTSSIDSAISSISNSSLPQKSSSDYKDISMAEIRNLISVAGSAENLIQHLLRDKSSAASQNAQLWKLVDKQRALLLGLNKDMERMTRERDRYRKKLKELHAIQSSGESENKGEDSPPVDMEDSGDQNDLQNFTVTGLDSLSDLQQPILQEPLAMPPALHISKHSTERDVLPNKSNSSSSPASSTVKAPSTSGSDDDHHRPQQLKLQGLKTKLSQPTFSFQEATPLAESPAKVFSLTRKGPPKPLDLKQQSNDEKGVLQHSGTEFASDPESEEDFSDEPVERGRGRSRQEDDKKRQLAFLRDQGESDRSKKDKPLQTEHNQGEEHQLGIKSTITPDQRPVTPQNQGINRDQLPLPTLAGTSFYHDSENLLSPALRSPGLPASPRPADRPLASPLPSLNRDIHPPMNSLPKSPRGGNFALSPRAPKQPLPAPTGLQPGVIVGQRQQETSPLSHLSSGGEHDRLHVHEPQSHPNDIPTIYRGLVSPSWPDLLLPPNALPSIQVKVASSRLKTSRNSIFALKASEDSIIFSLSIFSRYSRNELWRVEKVPGTLIQLESQLRPKCAQLPKLPDRRIFNGHSPTILDSRRKAIDTYFDELLDTPIDEHGAALICKYLSTDVMEPDGSNRANQGSRGPTESENTGRLRKEGYLTKKGKNFGGWKSRYFSIDSQELKYFETPGGTHLGTIRLANARIGRQTTDYVTQDEYDGEGQYRHAFLILEQKRKDSNNYIRHVLCAENDFERDEWVDVLLRYASEPGSYEKPVVSGADETSESMINARAVLKGTDYGDAMADSSNKSSSPTLGQSGSPSPTSTSSAILDAPSPEPLASAKAMNISAPMNGTVIQDAGLWGNKPNMPNQPKERDQKIRNLFHFARKPSHEQLGSTHGLGENLNGRAVGTKSKANVRPVFGLPLAEAVEFCGPENIDVMLPAVVYRCIEYLRAKRAASEEGLFRLSGSNIVIKTLKERFNIEGDVDLVEDEEYYDVHAVASLFKAYLRELPSTLLTRDLHPDFLQVLELDNKTHKIAALHILVHRLPPANYTLLKVLSQYLLEVVQNCEENKMSVKNVGIVFSPTLNIPAPVFSMFLLDFHEIFVAEHPPEIALPRPVPETKPQMQNATAPPVRHSRFPSQSSDPSILGQNAVRATDYRLDPTSEFGFTPVHGQSYESRHYGPLPTKDIQATARFPELQPVQPTSTPTYRMLAPENPASLKAKRRESALLFMR